MPADFAPTNLTNHFLIAMPAMAERVIFVTGDVAGTDAEKFLEESRCRWLAKPFRLADLVRTAREVLATN